MAETETENNRPRRVLLSGFEPFAGALRNASEDVVNEVIRRAGLNQLAAQDEHGPLEISAVTLPVEYNRASAELLAEMKAHQPDVVISVGLAERKRRMHLERVGVNLRDAPIPDNAGNQPQDKPVVAGGADALFATLNLRGAYERINAAGLPVKLSLSAGTYVCNDVLYSALHHVAEAGLETRVGFLHVPDTYAHDAGVSVNEAANALDMLLAESLAGS